MPVALHCWDNRPSLFYPGILCMLSILFACKTKVLIIACRNKEVSISLLYSRSQSIVRPFLHHSAWPGHYPFVWCGGGIYRSDERLSGRAHQGMVLIHRYFSLAKLQA